MCTQDLTAIIPIRIDSPDRLRNIKYVVKFLLNFYDCKIIIKEVDDIQKVFLESNPRITYIFEKTDNTSFFHRTKILNDMLEMVTTKYVVNHDCDILIPQSNMDKSLKLLEQGYDMVLPYQIGSIIPHWPLNEWHLDQLTNSKDTLFLEQLIESQKRIDLRGGLKAFEDLGYNAVWTIGGIQFFKTKIYKKAFGENEEFIDWGPEDQERGYRFIKLGYKLGFIDTGTICHIHHKESVATDSKNEYNKKNHLLWDYVKTLKSKDDMINYMRSLPYTKERNFG
jgi:predicted glycosyltransferase involved in capsule biosynthesis